MRFILPLHFMLFLLFNEDLFAHFVFFVQLPTQEKLLRIVRDKSYSVKPYFVNGSRERNKVKCPDHFAFDPVTALRGFLLPQRKVPGCHW